MRMTSSSLRQIRSKQPHTPSSEAYAQMRQMQAATLKETVSAGDFEEVSVNASTRKKMDSVATAWKRVKK